VRVVDPAQIILFGSRARGDARQDSDYDLLVVLDEILDRRGTRIAIRRVLDDLPIAKDIIVATTDEVSARGGRPRGVLHWALAEGRVLYERA
jgi:predicted nucleotidyltransferase